MCSVPGYDASSRVEDLAAEVNKGLSSIAIGKKQNGTELSSSVNHEEKIEQIENSYMYI